MNVAEPATIHVPISEWGIDHWSALAYIETCVVDRANAEGTPYTGKLDLDRLRCNPSRHGEWRGRISTARGMVTQWEPSYGTRLKGFDKNKSKLLAEHDDWDCIFDMQRENILTVLAPRQGVVRLTERGVALAQHVRAFKARGGSFVRFAYEFDADMLLDYKPEPVKPGQLTAADIRSGRCYEARRTAFVGAANEANDRQVIFVNESRTEVQYDSPTVRDGVQYPILSMEKFVKWAKRDITELMPKGDWRTYNYVKNGNRTTRTEVARKS